MDIYKPTSFIANSATTPTPKQPCCQTWNEDTLELAKISNRPIFLSIGYATCHWCHVMEEESFENQDFADFINENFICIK